MINGLKRDDENGNQEKRKTEPNMIIDHSIVNTSGTTHMCGMEC